MMVSKLGPSYVSAVLRSPLAHEMTAIRENEVAAVTAGNLAVADYLNTKGTPHLFLNTSDPRFGDAKKYPYSVPFLPSFDTEMTTYVKHILSVKPSAKIGVLYQNDSYGRAVVYLASDASSLVTGTALMVDGGWTAD